MHFGYLYRCIDCKIKKKPNPPTVVLNIREKENIKCKIYTYFICMYIYLLPCFSISVLRNKFSSADSITARSAWLFVQSFCHIVEHMNWERYTMDTHFVKCTIDIYTVHKKFSTTKTCRIILLFKIIYQNKLIIWLWGSARYEVHHSYLSSGV